MNKEEVSEIIRENGVRFNTCFFDPPYPKFWINIFHHPAFIIYYEPDTGLCVARQGAPKMRYTSTPPPVFESAETYYIGVVHSYKHLFHDIDKTELAIIRQVTSRPSLHVYCRWQEPEIVRKKDGCPERLLTQVMDYLDARVGEKGWPVSL